jgi:hypothetical protein
VIRRCKRPIAGAACALHRGHAGDCAPFLGMSEGMAHALDELDDDDDDGAALHASPYAARELRVGGGVMVSRAAPTVTSIRIAGALAYPPGVLPDRDAGGYVEHGDGGLGFAPFVVRERETGAYLTSSQSARVLPWESSIRNAARFRERSEAAWWAKHAGPPAYVECVELGTDGALAMLRDTRQEWRDRLAAAVRLDELARYGVSDALCRCTPGYGDLVDEVATCHGCGRVMLASTVGELVRASQVATATPERIVARGRTVDARPAEVVERRPGACADCLTRAACFERGNCWIE